MRTARSSRESMPTAASSVRPRWAAPRVDHRRRLGDLRDRRQRNRRVTARGRAAGRVGGARRRPGSRRGPQRRSGGLARAGDVDEPPRQRRHPIAHQPGVWFTNGGSRGRLGRLIPRAIGAGDRTGGSAPYPGWSSIDSIATSPRAARLRRRRWPSRTGWRWWPRRSAATPAPAAVAAPHRRPRLPLFHEQLPHLLGHPGVRAAIESHSTGVLLDGPPAVEVAAYARERTAGLGFDQCAQRWTPCSASRCRANSLWPRRGDGGGDPPCPR